MIKISSESCKFLRVSMAVLNDPFLTKKILLVQFVHFYFLLIFVSTFIPHVGFCVSIFVLLDKLVGIKIRYYKIYLISYLLLK